MKKWLQYKYTLILCCLLVGNASLHAQDEAYNIRPFNNNFATAFNQIPEQLVPVNATLLATSYQWEKSIRPLDGFAAISGATGASYTFTAPITQNTYYRRKYTIGSAVAYSNVVKMESVSTTWENVNYVREQDIMVPGQSDWKVIDQLPIGQKRQNTLYIDGLGRPIQHVSKEAGTPLPGTTIWGDIVHFSVYDELGRKGKQYLPYVTTSQLGKIKSNTISNQQNYYLTFYDETNPFSITTFESSPLMRPINVKQRGTSWATSNGNSANYDLNTLADNVQIFTIDPAAGSIPIRKGVYPANSLYKNISIDENGKQMIEFIDSKGLQVLTKMQLNDNPAEGHDGWICTYSVYDDFGLLRYQLQPEAVKYLAVNSWSFAGTNGNIVLDEQCFRYEYDSKHRMILKKAPGAEHLLMLYDKRDRVVFMQDGNQRSKTPSEWTVNIYDELDRPLLSVLYQTLKTVTVLQADIDAIPANNNITLSALSTTINTYCNPITATDLNNTDVTTILKLNYYDNYSYAGVKSFDVTHQNNLAYATGGEPIVVTQRTLSMPTGQVTRVLGTTTYLRSTVYYDEKSRPIQTLDDNIKTATDVTTLQYQWDGRLLSSHTKHTATGTAYTNYNIITKNSFDRIGRTNKIEKKYGTNAFLTIATYDFDDVGRLKTKHLAPGTGSGGADLESLNYSYNIHNNITGINKDYALKTPGVYNKWSNYFGMYLGYDNRDGVFAAAKLNGLVTGILWNTQGDDAQRKYDYEYDNAGRLTMAIFNEKQLPANTWDNTKMNFSVTGNSGGLITYDLNGNLLSMVQKGVLPGNTTPVNVDNLTYTYANLSNRLLKVVDNSDAGSANGKLGDFNDGANGSNNDYVYDANGNLVIDLNKNAKELNGVPNAHGIKYNFLDKPEEIRIVGKGLIKIVYDATGNKVQRSYTPEGGTTKTTYYVNQFVYEENNLQFINFEEGRIREISAVNTNNGYDYLQLDGNINLATGKKGVFDYFIRDYQSNVRMILTRELHKGSNSCTMETARAANEESLFGKIDANGSPSAGNEVAARFATSSIPGAAWTDNTSSYVSRVGALAGSKIGPNSLLKVMAGDKLSATTQYFYKDPVVNTNTPGIVSNVLGSLIQVIGGSSVTNGITKAGATGINTMLNGSIPFESATSPDAGNSTGNKPKAYLTLLFFDERFNFVPENSTISRVQTSGNGADPLTMLNIKAPKNGYAYVFVSNESNEHVYFDNLQVTHERGAILEENHYYSYGLKIAGISSKKMGLDGNGNITNNYLYQGDNSELEEYIQWNDFPLRNYDAQIGRWIQIDPYSEFPSGYEGMGNNPISFTDPSGGMIASGVFKGMTQAGKTVVLTLGGGLVGTIIGAMVSGEDNKDKGMFKGFAFGATIGLGTSFGLRVSVSFVTQAAGNLNGLNNSGSNSENLNNNNIELLKNVILFIPGKDMSKMSKSNGLNFGQWHIIVTDDIRKADKALAKYLRGASLNTLVLSVHGSPGLIEIHPGANAEGAGSLELYNSGKESDRNILGAARVGILDALKRVINTVKVGGKLVVTGCNAGLGDLGVDLGKELLCLNQKNIEVFLNQDKSSMAFEVDTKKRPTGYAVVGVASGLTERKNFSLGWRKIMLENNGGLLKIINLMDIPGNSGNLKLNNVKGAPVEIMKK